MRRAAKVDRNQAEVVAILRQAGATVYPSHAVGQGFPDLVVGYRKINYLMEVKDGDKPPSGRKLTKDQIKFFDEWLGQVVKVETGEEALRAIGAIK